MHNPSFPIFVSAMFLFFTITAHADFREVLEAYQNRDGGALLAEVESAVRKKDDDGLMLFLYAMSFDVATSEYNSAAKKPKTTLRKILTPQQWDKLQELLTQATQNSSPDSQYYLAVNSPFATGLASYEKVTAEYASRGSHLAMLQSTLSNKAEAGDIEAQLALAFRYFGYDRFGCKNQSKDSSCQSIDETKGRYWLKRAVRNYETSGKANWDLFASRMCKFLRSTANRDQSKLKQAYLWALKGINERAANVSESKNCLRQMHDSHELKHIAPELHGKEFDSAEFKMIAYRAKPTELPIEIIEVRKETWEQEQPIFTYYFGSGLELYVDGRVLFGFADYPKGLLMEVDAKTVQAFLADIKKTGFPQWTTANSSTGHCSDFDSCRTSDMYVTLKGGDDGHRLFFSIIPEYLLGGTHASENRKRMAIIKTLVDKYFPTQQLRCKLGNSEEKRQACLEFDEQLVAIAKGGD